ncbi:centromere/kinetochore protein zw10-like [Haematobia irritans]|uniref:centromere/kinetochore protein zw10-like n=1 Tax=Haematobia irritans TaxID=7368 RepID=UPI003F4F716E
MSTSFRDHAKKLLSNGVSSPDCTKTIKVRTLEQIKIFQDRIRKYIDDKYADFLPNYSLSDVYIDEGESLLHEAEYLLKNIGNDTNMALSEANLELSQCLEELQEVVIGIKLAYRIIKIDELFQCLENSNASKDYLTVLDLLGKIRTFVCNDQTSNIDMLLQKCECYESIKVKYHIQSNILQQNLQHRFESLVNFSEKKFPSTKSVNLKVSKDIAQLRDAVIALFQLRYNPMKLFNFILEDCITPLITKPVSVEYNDEDGYNLMSISFSLKRACSLRPSYKVVFAHINTLFKCLTNINVNISGHQYVFSIMGNHIKEKFLKLLVEECLMHAIPQTMDEFRKCTLVEDVQQFERIMVDCYFIDPKKDNALSEFVVKYDTLFYEHFSKNVFQNARSIMLRDLQDMTLITEEAINTNNSISTNQCMISKHILDLVKLMERILQERLRLPEIKENSGVQCFQDTIPIIINTYCSDVPKSHEKLIESIPQQAALFYNNCTFLSHWLFKNAEYGVPTYAVLINNLQSTGIRIFEVQVDHQKKLLLEILSDLDFPNTYSIGTNPLKLLRQCLRQLDLLKNVWLNVLPLSIYNSAFCTLLNVLCEDIIKRILSLEDITTTVANELCELITTILEKGPQFFTEKHTVVQITSWIKLQQLQMILRASLQEITEQWCDGAGILTLNYKAEEIRHLIRALFQNTDLRAKALSMIS